MTTFAREDVARACRAWGSMLWLPAGQGIDGVRLLWALSGCESSFGANATPRHEPAYDVGGAYAANPKMAKLLAEYGSAAACSYGPWQLLLVNCSAFTSPDDMANLNRCAMETTAFLNRRILRGENATSVEKIAEAYNSGKWKWQTVPAGVARYGQQCLDYYENEPMPEASV